MEAALNRLHEVYAGINTGKPRPALLDGVRVEYHGSLTPLKHLALVSTADKALVVQPFDPNSLGEIERAIRKSGLGLSTVPAKTSILIPIPPLTGDRKEELAKFAHKVAEEQLVAVRNVRREILRHVRQFEKVWSVDELNAATKAADELMVRFCKAIDEAREAKTEDLTAADSHWNPAQDSGKRKRKGRPDAPWTRPQDHPESCF
jgi:ribosome recycling factor